MPRYFLGELVMEIHFNKNALNGQYLKPRVDTTQTDTSAHQKRNFIRKLEQSNPWK